MVPSALSDLTYELLVESLKIVHEAESEPYINCFNVYYCAYMEV